MPDPITIPTETLLPVQWLRAGPPPNLRIYNPAIVRFSGRLLLACRVDSGEPDNMQRRIAVCALNDRLQVIPGSVSSFSDTIQNGGNLHYDPRFLVYRDRLFIHYNNNFQTRPNQIYLVELDPDTLEAKSPAKLLALDGPRREIEKNWMFFDHEGDLLAVYTIAPHVILRAELTGAGPVVCRPVYQTAWDVSPYAARWGEPCGGTPPVRHNDVYVSFFHSRYPVNRRLSRLLRYWPIPSDATLPRYLVAIERRLRRLFSQVRYVGGAYAFEAAPPFRPVWLTTEPLLRPENELVRQYHRRTNPFADGIVYPCGTVQANRHWLVSYGVHDERCVLCLIPYQDLQYASPDNV